MIRCLLLIAVFCVPPAMRAQNAPATNGGQDAPSTERTTSLRQAGQNQQDEDRKEQKEKHSKRIFLIVPAFDVISANSKDIKPLTKGEKFHLFLVGAFDPFEWLWSGAEAGLEQAAGEQKGYGQGAAGYGKRFGAAMADGATGAFFGTFLLPTVLHQDPRYFRKGEGSFGGRLGYSITRTVITRSDNGKRQFNYSFVGGSLISGGLSNIYYPHDDRGFGLTMSRTGIAFFSASGFNVAKEFWPDFARKFQRKKKIKP
jgi:hypothetical protein